MFRDAVKKLSLRKKLTILATVGVLLPIFVLTYLQYRSLSELQIKTKGAFKDNVRQGLVAVELKIKQRLEDLAVQTLDPIDIKRAHPEIEEIFTDSSDQKKTDLFNKARMTENFLD